jgi:hypothetical protein
MLTFGVYAHLGADDERRALDALPDLNSDAVRQRVGKGAM